MRKTRGGGGGGRWRWDGKCGEERGDEGEGEGEKGGEATHREGIRDGLPLGHLTRLRSSSRRRGPTKSVEACDVIPLGTHAARRHLAERVRHLPSPAYAAYCKRTTIAPLPVVPFLSLALFFLVLRFSVLPLLPLPSRPSPSPNNPTPLVSAR